MMTRRNLVGRALRTKYALERDGLPRTADLIGELVKEILRLYRTRQPPDEPRLMTGAERAAMETETAEVRRNFDRLLSEIQTPPQRTR